MGVDSTSDAGGRGSVIFRVEAGGREVFKTPLLREGARPSRLRGSCRGRRISSSR